jgi:hypothetical protein
MIKIAPAGKGVSPAFNRQPKVASMKRVAQPKTVAQPKAVAQPKMVVQSKAPVSGVTVKRPVAPPVYKPQPPLKTVQAKKVAPAQARVAAHAMKLPAAPPAFRPQTTQATAVTKPAIATTVQRKQPVAPPVYRPQQTPKVLQTKKLLGQTQPAVHKLRQPVVSSFRQQTIQRSEQVPGFSGFFAGGLPEKNRGGTFNKVWSEVAPMELDDEPVSHSSIKFSKKSKKHLVEFADIDHIQDEENTHAEDKLAVVIHQRAIEIYYKTGEMPALVEIPEFFVSASPCSSTFGTTKKVTGCTENLIGWATKGVLVRSEDGCESYVRMRIGRLIVNKLYKGNTYEDAGNSMAAIILMKAKKAIGGWEIQNDPGKLHVDKIPGYKRKG